MCRVLGIPRSTLYYDRKNPQRALDTPEQIRVVQQDLEEHHYSFGRRVTKKNLEKKGVIFSQRKISRIFKLLDYKSKYGRKKCHNVYTSKATEKYIRANIFNNLPEYEQRTENVWSMDFTERKINGKKFYLCAIIGVNTKIVYAHNYSYKLDTRLAIQTVMDAVKRWEKPVMLMTDRGSQFTSKAFYDMIEKLGIVHSMSRPYTSIDNRFIETFWKTMKTEIEARRNYTEEDYRMVVDYFMEYYNKLRPHSSLGYVSPYKASGICA